MFKKILLSIVGMSAIGVLSAQDIKIINPGSSDALNGGYHYEVSSESNPDIYKTFWVVNQTASTKTIKVRRLEVSSVSGTDNATCWDVCPPPIDAGSQVDWTSPSTQDVMANDTNKTFSAHLYPEGVSGCSHYRYYWYFDDNSYIDSVDVYFNHGEACQQIASTSKLAPTKESIKIYPNPSQGQVNIDLSLPQGKSYNMSVVNVVGQNVKSLSNISSGVNSYNWSDLNAGFYFVVIDDGSKTILTEKIQVSK